MPCAGPPTQREGWHFLALPGRKAHRSPTSQKRRRNARCFAHLALIPLAHAVLRRVARHRRRQQAGVGVFGNAWLSRSSSSGRSSHLRRAALQERPHARTLGLRERGGNALSAHGAERPAAAAQRRALQCESSLQATALPRADGQHMVLSPSACAGRDTFESVEDPRARQKAATQRAQDAAAARRTATGILSFSLSLSFSFSFLSLPPPGADRAACAAGKPPCRARPRGARAARQSRVRGAGAWGGGGEAGGGVRLVSACVGGYAPPSAAARPLRRLRGRGGPSARTGARARARALRGPPHALQIYCSAAAPRLLCFCPRRFDAPLLQRRAARRRHRARLQRLAAADMAGERVLVTGAGGFIGSHVVRRRTCARPPTSDRLRGCAGKVTRPDSCTPPLSGLLRHPE